MIPGSHRRPHPLHDVIDAHDPALAAVENPDDPAYAAHPDEVDVPVTAGDVVVADARLIHGAHPNRSARERTNITLWWHPGYAALPPGIRARLWSIVRREEVDTDPAASQPLYPHRWPEPWRSRILPVMADDPGPGRAGGVGPQAVLRLIPSPIASDRPPVSIDRRPIINISCRSRRVALLRLGSSTP